MSHGDSITRLPEGFTRDRPDRLVAVRRPRRRRSGTSTGSSSIPRSSTPRRGRDVLRNFVRRASPGVARPGRRRTSSTRPSPASASGSTRHARRDRLGRARHLRPVGRRRLGGRGGPRPSRGRRPADLHLRRPRPDAQEGVGAAPGHLRARPRDEAWSWSTRASASSPGWPASRTPSRSGRSSATSSSGSSRRRPTTSIGRIDFLTQGTLYPDVIESATSETKAAQKIKTHHNVGGLPADLRFQLIEPLRYLFKDEVRAVGLELGLPEAMVLRQPFPGPGLAIRIIGEVTAERLDTLREADWIVIDEIKARRPVPQPVAVASRS